MNRTPPTILARMAIAMACAAACCSCTYKLKFGNSPRFHPVNVAGVTFTPAVILGLNGPVLHVKTSRPNPVTDEIDTILLADIAVAVTAGEEDGGIPVTLEQDGNDEVLLESGDVMLTGSLTAALPKDTPPEKCTKVTVTYRGQSATSVLQPAQ